MSKACLDCSCICPACGKTRDDDIDDTLREVRDEWGEILIRWSKASGQEALAHACNELSDTFRQGGKFEVKDE